jgi:TonB family protein
MKTRFRAAVVLICWLFAAAGAAEDDSDVTHLTDDTGNRMPLQTVVPVYPERALADRIEGEVQVCFNVDREGRTSRIAVRRSSNRLFEKPAMRAIRGSSYAPLPQGEELSGIKTCRTFRFLLDPVAIEVPDELSADVEP